MWLETHKIGFTLSVSGSIEKKSRKCQKGFSLIELLVVMAILAALAGISVPLSVQFIRAQSINRASGLLVGLIEEASSQAITRQNYIWLGLSVDTTRKGVWAALYDSGKIQDAAATDLQPLSKPVFLEGVTLKEAEQLPQVELEQVSGQNTKDLLSVMAEDAYPPIERSNASGQKLRFDKVVLFSPRGEALVQANTFSHWILIGMASITEGTSGAAVFQISGLTARCSVQRP